MNFLEVSMSFARVFLARRSWEIRHSFAESSMIVFGGGGGLEIVGVVEKWEWNKLLRIRERRETND